VVGARNCPEAFVRTEALARLAALAVS